MTQAADCARDQQLAQYIKALAEEFLKRTRDQVSAFGEQLEKLSQGDTRVLQDMQAVAHKIHGSGAVFGFARISECAEHLERSTDPMVKAWTAGTAAPGAQYAEVLKPRVAQLVQAVEAESRLFRSK